MDYLEVVNSFGIGSSRYISCLPFNSTLSGSLIDNDNNMYLLTVPIGGAIAHWNIKKKERLGYKILHADAITCLLRFKPFVELSNDKHINSNNEWFYNKSYHISCSYSGEIGIWDENWNEKQKFKIPDPKGDNKIMHISMDDYQPIEISNGKIIRRLALSSEHGNCKIIILDLQFQLDSGQLSIFIHSEYKDSLYFFGEMIGNNQMLVIQQNVGKQGYSDDRTMIVSNNIDKDDKEPFINLIKMEIKSNHNEMIPIQTSLNKGPECIVVVRLNCGYIALTRGRKVQVLNPYSDSDFEYLLEVNCAGSGLIKDILFSPSDYKSFLVPSSTNSELLHYSDSKLINRWKGQHGVVYSLKWAVPNKRLWIFDESGIHSLHLLDLDDNKENIDNNNYQLFYHQITCCGLDFNNEANQIACGDFQGNLIIWSIDNYRPIHIHSFGLPIRSLAWGKSEKYILVGLITGSLIHYNIENNESELVYNGDEGDGITVIQWNLGKTRLGCGTTGGNLMIYSFNDENINFNLEWSHLAHQPVQGTQDLKFGSINKYAEIWSLKFHPMDSNFIATCSEDQTTKIWNISMKKEHRPPLIGHTTAVTSVDWQVIPISNQIFLATCADDKTVRVWSTPNDTDQWKEIAIFDSTNDIGEWHTVTYLTFILNENQTPKILSVTQNGWVIVYDIFQKSKIYCKRVHLGSIEGLKWNVTKKKVITCSSDCLIHYFKIVN